jgi:DNA mismatch repair ATPase MutS
LLLVAAVFLPAYGQAVEQGLVEAIKNGDAGALAEYFHQSLEMTILEKDYMASKNQATRIMENFFKEHDPTDFVISFEGTKENSKYAIGSLDTGNGSFRVNLFFMNKEDKRLIYYLSIEKESQYELRPRP